MSTYLVRVANEVGTWNYVAKGKTVDEAIHHFRDNYGRDGHGPEPVIGVNHITDSEDYEQVLKFAKRRMEDIALEVKNLMAVVDDLVVRIDARPIVKEYGFATRQGYEIRQVIEAARDRLNAIDECIHLVHGYTEDN